MHVAIVGSREWPEPERVKAYVDSLPEGTVVVSGGAKGVDTWAEEAAKARGLEVMIFPADWKTYGKRAGMIRNQQIVLAADEVVAFHDGTSKGTAHTIKMARGMKKLGAVHLPTPEVEP